MKTAYTPTQQSLLHFALAHDWGRNAYISEITGALHLYDYDSREMVAFCDMASLRVWAGY